MRKSFFCFLGLAGMFILSVLSLSMFASFSGYSVKRPSQNESQTSEEKMTPIELGIEHAAERKDFKNAQKWFKKVLEQQPENAVAYNNLGNLDLLTGKYASAMQKYWKALQYDKTDDTNIYLNLGIVYYLQMDITQDEAYIGDEKSKAPKEDWKACSELAFDNAFENFQSATDACLVLGIPPVSVPEYNWVQKLLYDAAKRNRKKYEPTLIMAGGRSRNEWEIPVYWKKN